MKKVILLVLDGWGYNKKSYGNAIDIASTLNYDSIWKNNPHTTLKASGLDVGLPKYSSGTCEAGFENIGAGRIYEQELVSINRSITEKTFFEKQCFVKANKTLGAVHLIGLVSDAGIHSHINHLFALIDLARKFGTKVFVHAILDGKDVNPTSAKSYIKQIEKKLKGIGEIATISGRFFAMDNNLKWARTEQVYNLIMTGEGSYHRDAISALKSAYSKNETDEFVTPLLVGSNFHGVSENDSVIFFNFNPWHTRQLLQAFADPKFEEFRRRKLFKGYLCSMTRYDKDYEYAIAFDRPEMKNILGEVLSKNKIKQLRISESEKYRQVTYAFDNGREEPFPLCDWVLIPSPQPPYDKVPQMAAVEITDRLVKEINDNKYEFILADLVNADVVAHTGMLDAAVKAVEIIDECISRIAITAKKNDYILIITSDHGNAEYMLDRKGLMNCDHTANEVPFIIFNHDCQLRSSGKLADIAPTILHLMRIEIPKEMTGDILVKD